MMSTIVISCRGQLLKLPPEGVAISISILPGISILPDITFNSDGCQNLPLASHLPSALMLIVMCWEFIIN